MKFRTGLMLGIAFISGAGLSASVLTPHNASLILPAMAQESAHDDTSTNNNAETIRLLTLLGTVMDVTHSEYVEPLPDKKLIRNALDGMISNLDPHSAYMDTQQLKDMQDEMSGQFGGLGLQVQGDSGHVRVVSPIDGTPATRAGIQPGDVITMVDNKSIADLTLDQAVRKMRGKPGSQITLTILRPKTGKVSTLTLTREIIHVQIVRSSLYGRTGYIRLSEFDDSLEQEMHKAYEKLVHDVAKTPGNTLNGLILDLRSNPGGKLDQAIAVSRDFIREGEIVSIRGRHPEANQHWDAVGKDITNNLPIIVLTNSGSASASEIVSGALKDHHRAIILGEQTFGKGSVQTIIPIADQGALRLTTARYYTPSGRSIQGLGITPDVSVKESHDDDNAYVYHEADLAHVLTNSGGTTTKEEVRTDLPEAIKTVEHTPPQKWPAFDLTKPETDFQLQQALHLMNAITTTASERKKIIMTSLPTEYRPNVGIILFNHAGEVFMARRADLPGDIWQFPQGGIDEGEAPLHALWREMKEEIGTSDAILLREKIDWFFYDLPEHLIGKALGGRYRGQKQKWFILGFTGDDSAIRLDTHEEIEFNAWKWVPIDSILNGSLNLGFKKDVYERLLPDIKKLFQEVSTDWMRTKRA